MFDSNVTPARDATSLRFETESLTLYPGQFGQVRVAIEPQPTTADLMYESSDEDIADISGFGVVEGVAPGTCTIVVRDTVSGLEATYQVTVVEPDDDSSDDQGEADSDDTDRDDGDTAREDADDTNRDDANDTNRDDANDTNRESGNDSNQDNGNDANREGGNERTVVSPTNKALPQTGDNTMQLMSWASVCILVGLFALGLGISQYLLLLRED